MPGFQDKVCWSRLARPDLRAIVACYLPVNAPWLNAIEPKWVHGKHAVVEPDRELTAAEVAGFHGPGDPGRRRPARTITAAHLRAFVARSARLSRLSP